MFKTLGLALFALAAVGPLHASEVHLIDGSVLKGEVTQTADQVTVKTLVGTQTIPKDKVASIVESPDAATSPTASSVPAGGSGGTGSPYVDEVLRRRAKYGNNDGIPRTSLVQTRQILFTLGEINYTGDAYLVKDGTGNTVLNDSDLGSLSYGLAVARSYNDFIAWEIWADYSNITKGYTYNNPPAAPSNVSTTLNRFDVGIGPKLQHAIALGEPEQSMNLIPNIGLTPFFAASSGSTYDQNGYESFSHSNVGASLNVGLDFQFGGALLAIKARYLLSNDVNGGLHTSNTSAWLPQVGAGFAF